MRRLLLLALSLVPLTAAADPAARRVEATAPERRAPRAETHRGPALELKTERVVVFKDGYALVARTGRARADAQGRVHTDQLPAGAILGAFWVTPVTRGVEVAAVRAESLEVELEEERAGECPSLAALLDAHAGSAVELRLKGGERVTGKLRSVLEAAGLVVIDGEGGGRAIPVGQVEGVERLRSATCTMTEKKVETQRRLTVELGNGAANRDVELRLFYFAPGIRWIPTYRVNLTGEDRAEVSLTGEILNELEDIDGPVDLVVGVPHFRFKDTPSPLSLERVLRGALQQAAPQLMGQLSNAMFGNNAFSSRASEVRAPASQPAASDDPQLREAESHELYVYSVPRLALKRGARAQVPLLQHAVKAKHVYTIDLVTPRDANRPDLVENAVWHKLALENTGRAPWTTGPALVLKDGLPLGQDLLTYTPPGGASLLPITRAVGVRATLNDEELRREPAAQSINGRTYARHHHRAKLRLQNLKGRAAEVRVTLRARGRAAEGVAARYEPGDLVNPELVVERSLKLKAGQEKTVPLDYASLR